MLDLSSLRAAVSALTEAVRLSEDDALRVYETAVRFQKDAQHLLGQLEKSND